MTLTINMADGNNCRFEARDGGEEVLRQIEEEDGQFIKFRNGKYKCLINREYIVSIVVWED